MRRTWNARLAFALSILSKYSSPARKPPTESEIERLKQFSDTEEEAKLPPPDLARAIVARELAEMLKEDSRSMNADGSLASAVH